MRLSHSVALARMLLRFFGRRVLRAGVLRSRSVRYAAGLVVLALLASSSVAAYLFLKPLKSDREIWDLLLDLATVSVVLWVLVAFLFVKVLFLNADGLLQLTFHLPVTNRERSVAFLLYESVMVMLFAGTGFVALACASLALLGPTAVPLVLTAIVLPALLVYLSLSVVYQLFARLVEAVGLRRMEPFALVLLIFAGLLAYASRTAELTASITSAYLDDRPRFVWTSSVRGAADHIGLVPTLLGAIVVLALLVVLTVLLAPNRHVRASRYLPVPIPVRLRRVLGPYDSCAVRSTQTWLAASLAVALTVALCLAPRVHPLWAVSMVGLGGLYQFAATEPLREMPGARPPAWLTYVRLLKAQAIVMLALTGPLLAFVAASDPGLVRTAAFPLLGALAGVVLTVAVGIVFPAENDNPFSLFLGLSVTVALLGVAALAVGLLQLPAAAVAASLVGVGAFAVGTSIHTISKHESRRRHEEARPAGQQRPRSGAHHHPQRGGDTAVPHVLDV